MKLKGELVGVPEGEVYPQTFAAGTDCPPELVEAALELGVLETAEEEAERLAAEAKKK